MHSAGLIVHDRGRFADDWIYIHDRSGQVGRVLRVTCEPVDPRLAANLPGNAERAHYPLF